MNSLQEALEGLADGVKGEIIGDMLYAQLRPPPRHQHALGAVLVDVQGGDPGWWILAEPGIRVSPAGEFSPDVAGWHKEKMPALPEGPITLVPD